MASVKSGTAGRTVRSSQSFSTSQRFVINPTPEQLRRWFFRYQRTQGLGSQVEVLAHHDPLTGLPNRLLFHARMEHALARANRIKSQLAVLFLDLDRFKTINDSYGHPAGDQLLQEVSHH